MANTVKRRPVIFRLVMTDGSVWEVTKPWVHPEGEHCEKIDTLVIGIFRFDEVPKHEQWLADDSGIEQLVDFQSGRGEHFLVFGAALKPVECAPDDPEALRVSQTEGGAARLVMAKPENQALPVFIDTKGVARKMGPFGKNDEGSIAELLPENVARIEYAQNVQILRREVDRLLAEEVETDEAPKQKVVSSAAETPKPATPGAGGAPLPTYG